MLMGTSIKQILYIERTLTLKQPEQFEFFNHNITLHSCSALEIMLFVRATRAYGWPYRVNNAIRTCHQRIRLAL